MISNIICSQYNIQNQTRPAASGGQPLLTQPSLSAPTPDTDRFSLAHFAGPKLGDSYTKSDVLNQLWREAHTIDLNGPNDTGGLCFDPTEEDLARLAQQAEARGLDGQMDFSKISSDFSKTFSTVHAGNLGDAIDYLASRAVALEGQLQRNFTGEALEQKRRELAEVVQQGKTELIDSYTSRLQTALGLSDADTQEVRSALESLFSQRVQDFQSVQSQMPDTLTGTQDEWLLNQDQYMASRLREAAAPISDSASGGKLTLGDLRAAGEIAGAYQEMYQRVSEGSGGDEAFLALDLSMIDMKTETLIQKGVVSETMAGMLQGSLEQRHQAVMDLADQRLADRREHALSGQGPMPNLDRGLFQSIYDSVLGSFRQNGGDALAAIRDGVAFGKTATAQAGRNHTKVSRWGVSKADYWERFYTSCEVSDWHGGKRTQKSEYEKYADSWQHFVTTLSGLDGRFLAPSGENIPSYNQHGFLNVMG